MKTIIILFIVLLQLSIFGQDEDKQKIRQQILSKTDSIALKNLSSEFEANYRVNREEAINLFKSKGYPIKKTNSDGSGFELQRLLNGRPIYNVTYNRIAAQTTSTDDVWDPYGFSLDGTGIDIGLWDEGSVYVDHNSFREGAYGQRHAYFIDSTGSTVSDHSTHVAGTIIADNDNYYAKGMANESVLYSRDWNWDVTEMINAAAGLDPNISNPLILSNHSYGENPGWAYDDFRGVGTKAWYWMAFDYQFEDPMFGDYNQISRDYDQIAFNAPYYTIVWAAGNDRGEGPEPNAPHWVWNGNSWISSTSWHPKDGGDNLFDCIPPEGVAKNILTVGAIDDIPSGYQIPSDVKQISTYFSDWGPTKDGRIKPDIVANGDNLYSTLPNNTFGSKSGTSMAAPNVTGALALLLQYYKNTHSNTIPLSSTLKAVVIHTTDEAGTSPGPDYKHGWGLLNTYKAAQLISQDQNKPTTIQELSLQNGHTYTLNNLYSDGMQPIRVTMVWNDIPPSNYQTGPILVHDLDVRVYQEATTYYPWKLNPNNPELAATTGDNTKDNVEQILLQSPGEGYYSLVVSHKNSLSSNQMFSIIVSGFTEPFVTFNLKQIGYENQTFGQAAYWDNSIWNYVPPTQAVTLSIDRHHFLSTQDYRTSTYEKFHKWEDNLPTTTDWYRNWDTLSIKSNTTLVSSRFVPTSSSYVKNSLEGILTLTDNVTDSIQFKDPWLVDYNEQPYGMRSRGLEAPFLNASSPLNITQSSNYKGVFLDQGADWQPPYYSVKAISPQDITLTQTGKTHKFYFQNWTGSGVQFKYTTAQETPVVFTSGNAVVNANLKGHLLSDASLAFSGNGQRKLVRDSYGIYHAVYHTSTGIWYTRSATSDFNGTWTADKQIYMYGANPSIDIYGQNVKIVFEAYDETSTYIFLAEFNYTNFTTASITTIDDQCQASLYPNMYPVVAATQTEVFVLYKKNNSSGLQYKRKYWNNNTQQWIDVPVATLSNTDGASCNPSLASWYTNDAIHIVWQQGESQIRYYFSYRQGFPRLFNSYEIVSNGSGNEKNQYPSISLHSSQQNPIVS